MELLELAPSLPPRKGGQARRQGWGGRATTPIIIDLGYSSPGLASTRPPATSDPVRSPGSGWVVQFCGA